MNPSEAATVLGVIVSVDARLTARSKEDAENRSKAWALTQICPSNWPED